MLVPSQHKANAERVNLEQCWLELTRVTLPGLAKRNGWPIERDHCFQRVLLDAACGGCWYDSIAGRPAYKAATDRILCHALSLGKKAMIDTELLPALNRQSLIYRGRI